MCRRYQYRRSPVARSHAATVCYSGRQVLTYFEFDTLSADGESFGLSEANELAEDYSPRHGKWMLRIIATADKPAVVVARCADA